MDAYDILNIAQNRELQDLGERQSDIGEQLRVGYAMGPGMESGFGAGEGIRLKREADEARSDILQNYRIRREIIKKREEMAKKAAEDQKRANWMKLGGMGLGAVLAPVTGGGSMALGAGVGSSIGGSLGSALYGSGDIDLDWEGMNRMWKNWRA